MHPQRLYLRPDVGEETTHGIELDEALNAERGREEIAGQLPYFGNVALRPRHARHEEEGHGREHHEEHDILSLPYYEREGYGKENGLKLVITGWTDEPYSYLKVFDVAMLLSRWEGFGLAVVEYMAAEKNVVATKIDAIPTLVDDGVDGLLVEMDNPQDAADKVLWLYRHPKEATEMKSKALKKVIENYDISRVVDQHVEMFEQLSKE